MPDIYGPHRQTLEAAMKCLLDNIEKIRGELKLSLDMDPVEHVLGRIKSDESMREKCRRLNIPEDSHSALQEIHDAIGVRIVCAFLDDVYTIRDRLVELPCYDLILEKDYIRNAKPNGYRSLHLILRINRDGIMSGSIPAPDISEDTATGVCDDMPFYYAEIQLRTISMDTWAALEHHLKYKQNIGSRTALIVSELKRCADELASTDASMQTIRDALREL